MYVNICILTNEVLVMIREGLAATCPVPVSTCHEWICMPHEQLDFGGTHCNGANNSGTLGAAVNEFISIFTMYKYTIWFYIFDCIYSITI